MLFYTSLLPFLSFLCSFLSPFVGLFLPHFLPFLPLPQPEALWEGERVSDMWVPPAAPLPSFIASSNSKDQLRARRCKWNRLTGLLRFAVTWLVRLVGSFYVAKLSVSLCRCLSFNSFLSLSVFLSIYLSFSSFFLCHCLFFNQYSSNLTFITTSLDRNSIQLACV